MEARLAAAVGEDIGSEGLLETVEGLEYAGVCGNRVCEMGERVVLDPDTGRKLQSKLDQGAFQLTLDSCFRVVMKSGNREVWSFLTHIIRQHGRFARATIFTNSSFTALNA